LTDAKGKTIKKKTNYIDFLKLLSLYILQDSNNNNFSQILSKYNVNKREIFKRLISYNYSNPYIIKYINTYMNNKFDFYSFDEMEMINSIKFIMQMNNVDKLYFIKFNDLKDHNKPIIKSLLKTYFNMIKNSYINDLELNFLYEMLKNDIEYLETINKLINGETSKLNLKIANYSQNNNTESQIDINSKIEDQLSIPLSEDIININIELNAKKMNSKNCQSCPLFNNKLIAVDSNLLKVEPVDIGFILLNPGYDESLYNRLLVGESGKLFRSKLLNINPNITYIISNIIMCSTRTQADTGKTDKKLNQVIKKCKPNLKYIIDKFPAKIYIPIGKHAMESFDISGSIIENSGQVFNNIIPIIHPSAALRNDSNKIIFDKTFEVIKLVTDKISISKSSKNTIPNISTIEKKTKPSVDSIISNIKQSNSSKYNIPDEHVITDIDPSLTYLDSITLNYNDIVHIYLSPDGIKKYLFDSIKIPIYIKNSSLSNMNMLVNEVDQIFYVTKSEKYKLTKTLRDNIISNKYSALNPDKG